MKLKNQLEKKLSLINEKIKSSEEAYSKAYKLINSFFTSELIDNELTRTFALKKAALTNIYKELSLLVIKSKAIEKHKEAILLNEVTTKKGLEVLETHENRYSIFIADIHALTIFLENSLKKK